jgi:hypothetical protein
MATPSEHEQRNDDGGAADLEEIQLVSLPPIVPSSFARLDPNRFDRIALFDERRVVAGPRDPAEDPRYTLTVVDRPVPTAAGKNSKAKKKGGGASQREDMPASAEGQPEPPPPPPKKPLKNTAVFVVPAGREAEYAFGTRGGLRAMAESAGCLRLVAVSTGRSGVHRFPGGTGQVRRELQLVCRVLHYRGPAARSPADRRRLVSRAAAASGRGRRPHHPGGGEAGDAAAGTDEQNQIPFLALSEEVGVRNVVARGESELSGPYVIEQVPIPPAESEAEDEGEGPSGGQERGGAGDSDVVARRLYFLSSPLVVQSEVRYRGSALDPAAVGFEYHKTMVACLAWALLVRRRDCDDQDRDDRDGITENPKGGRPEDSGEQPEGAAGAAGSRRLRRRGLLVGLGGGGLLHYARHVLGASAEWVVAEVDPEVARVAKEHFGVQELVDSGLVEVRVGDGLLARARPAPPAKSADESAAPDEPAPAAPPLEEEGMGRESAAAAGKVGADEKDDGDDLLAFAPGSLSFVVIDVDSKDPTRGMSCPPQEFVEVPYLETLASLLRAPGEGVEGDGGGGVLLVNVSARDRSMLETACHNLRRVFPHVLLSPSSPRDDSLNVVVVASRHELAVPGGRERQPKEDELAGRFFDEESLPSASESAPAPDDQDDTWAEIYPPGDRKELQRLVEELKFWNPFGGSPKGKPANPGQKKGTNKKKKGKGRR